MTKALTKTFQGVWKLLPDDDPDTWSASLHRVEDGDEIWVYDFTELSVGEVFSKTGVKVEKTNKLSKAEAEQEAEDSLRLLLKGLSARTTVPVSEVTDHVLDALNALGAADMGGLDRVAQSTAKDPQESTGERS